MDIDERLRTGSGLESVSEERVMRYWLREEVDEADEPLDPDALETEPGLREELFERKPIAERVFPAEPADWYRVDLSEEELRDLRVVVGPRGEDWRAIAPDNRVESIAERVHEADDPAALDEEVPKDIGEVVELAEAIDPEGPESKLLVLKEGDDPAYVADGNHRAVAHVLSLMRGEPFSGQEAYLGVRE